jgi:hypothetical protein
VTERKGAIGTAHGEVDLDVANGIASEEIFEVLKIGMAGMGGVPVADGRQVGVVPEQPGEGCLDELLRRLLVTWPTLSNFQLCSEVSGGLCPDRRPPRMVLVGERTWATDSFVKERLILGAINSISKQVVTGARGETCDVAGR